ncbi:hypothetical protein Q0M94_11020 [Deinococcus radiomollis]|uniref:hypothetical protein n=1 Tax=Deinococcus radiomollis TaxID=468916 RepID=UPI003892C019
MKVARGSSAEHNSHIIPEATLGGSYCAPGEEHFEYADEVTTSTVAPRDTATAFQEFLKTRSLSLASVMLPELFSALVEFFENVRVENCSVDKSEDYLHCEIYQNSITFERLMYVPMEMMYDDCEEGNVGYREKWGLYVCTLPEHEPLPDAPDVPDVNLWSFDFSDSSTFAEAVRALPLMMWAERQGQVAAEASFDPVG